MFRAFEILAVTAGAFCSTGQPGPKALAIFPDTSIILASAPRANFFGFWFFKGIRALFECYFNRESPVTVFIYLGVQATDAGTGVVASLARLEASAVEF